MKKTTILIEGIYTTLNQEELKENIELAENIGAFLSNQGIDVIIPGTRAEEWIDNPEQRRMKHNQLLKPEYKVLFLQTKKDNYLARERFREIQDFYNQQRKKTNNEIDIDTMTQKEIKEYRGEIDLENMTEQEIKTKFREDTAKNKNIWMQSELGLLLKTYTLNGKLENNKKLEPTYNN